MCRYASLMVLAALFFCGAAAPVLADNRVALVIGNGAYVHVPHLPNPTHDAEDVAAALRRNGFETILGADLDQAGMQNAAIRFARAARTADVAVFYYSGHAMQYAGVNYLVPVDAELRDEADLRRMARVDEILADLQQAKNLRILVLDSCRDNPLADDLKRSIGLTRSASIGRGLAKIESPDGTIVSYSTQAGRTAEDGSDRNSPYTAAFLQHIEDKDDIATVFHRIGANVYQKTQGKQVPEISISFFGEFYLNGKLQITVAPASPSAPADPCATAESHWKSAEAIGTVEAYHDHLARFPGCTFAELAKVRIDNLNSKVAVVAPPVQPTSPTLQEPGLSKGQQVIDLSGDWQGYAFIGRKRVNYDWHISQEGQKLFGTISISTLEGLDKSTQAFEATIQDSVVIFRATRWLSPQLSTWCMAAGKLKLAEPTAPPELKGTWGANPISGGCPTGSYGRVQLVRR
jgi:caspase domain-containing protein